MGLRDTDLENGMGSLPQAGVALAGAFMMAGGALYLGHGKFRSVTPSVARPAGNRALYNNILLNWGITYYCIKQHGI